MSEPDPDAAFAEELTPPSLAVTVLMADAAQVSDGKLFILGGGLSVVGPRPQPLALALHIKVPWDRANVLHNWKVELLDDDGQPVMGGAQPIVVAGTFEAGRPAGHRPGTPLGVPLAINFPTLPLQPGRSYTWQLSIDDRTRNDWRASFTVRSG